MKDQDLLSLPTAPLKRHLLPAFFLVLFLGAIVLGPVLYFARHAFWPVPFHRAMDQALLLSTFGTLALFWPHIPFAKVWRLRHDVWKRILLGYFIAFVSAQAIIGFDLALCGFVAVHRTGHQIAVGLALALMAALLLPPVEETVFRGFLAHEFARTVGRGWGCTLSAIVFMLAHFLRVPVSVDHQPVHFWSGATALGAALLPLLHGSFLCERGLNLFLAGMILGGIFLHTGTLWLNAGLHSGWFLTLLVFSGLTRPLVPPRIAWLGSGDLLSSPITSLVFMLLAIWIWRYYLPLFTAFELGENAPSG